MYIELQTTTNFSFLRGASHPEELIHQAVALGFKTMAVTDRNTLAGVVRAHAAAEEMGIRLIIGCRLDLEDGPSLLAYPTNKVGYEQLCSLLSKGNLRTEKGQCLLYKRDVYGHAKDLKFIAVPPLALNATFDFEDEFKAHLAEYKEALGDELYLSAVRSYQGDDLKKLYRLNELSNRFHIPMVATNDVYYHHPMRRELQDVLTCVREKCTIYDAGFLLHENAERFLKPAHEMERLFRQYPDAICRTQEIAKACSFNLSSLQYVYPEEIVTPGRTPQEELEIQTWKGAREMFGDDLPEKTAATIKYELEFIRQMNYASYFLTVFDIVKFARNRGILCQGRGSAANSVVCFCLGITSVNPTKFDLLFERFISSARNEPPDIDVDFEHERREEVIQYIYEKYGRDRAAIVATVTRVHEKGAIRDVGRAMGLSVDAVNNISKSIWRHRDKITDSRAKESGIDPNDKYFKKILELTEQYIGFPRQLGQHTGGFVITRDKLTNLCPILNARMENRTCIEWNKDDIDALGFMKVDVLSLGMLTCIRKCFALIKQHYGLDYTLANIPQDDPLVYEMICRADTIGVFQIESRAQQSMLPRLKPKTFYDLVIEVAIVRPGPIQGDMIHPYLRRRNGLEPVEYPSKELEEILKRTLGVPLFQEQAMRIAISAAGFTAAEADALRRSMATFKVPGLVVGFREKLMQGMLKNGYSHEYAEKIFNQLEGFGSYGFPESHAASFALLVYVSAWIKCHYPDVFACGLLNSQPMGFYAPAQLVRDAREHGVEVRGVDVNFSDWDNLLEENTEKYHALRLGFRQVKGIRESDMDLLLKNRNEGFRTISQIADCGVSESTLERLADADAFRSMGLDRREALWEVSALSDNPIGLFKGQIHTSDEEAAVELPEMALSEHVLHDYAVTGLSVKAHPVSFIREKMDLLQVTPTGGLKDKKNGDTVKVAGLVLVRQRPATAGGVCFITIEDETGVANLVVFQNLFEEKYRKEILHSKLLMVKGTVQKEGLVIHVVVKHCEDWSGLLRTLAPDVTVAGKLKSGRATKEQKKEELFPGGRDFR